MGNIHQNFDQNHQQYIFLILSIATVRSSGRQKIVTTNQQFVLLLIIFYGAQLLTDQTFIMIIITLNTQNKVVLVDVSLHPPKPPQQFLLLPLQKTDVTCYLEYITTIYLFVCSGILQSSYLFKVTFNFTWMNKYTLKMQNVLHFTNYFPFYGQTVKGLFHIGKSNHRILCIL